MEGKKEKNIKKNGKERESESKRENDDKTSHSEKLELRSNFKTREYKYVIKIQPLWVF